MLLPASQQRLAQGDTILIFPEGTRTRPGETMTLQRGAANIAVRCGSDIRVVTIHCSQRMLDKESKWYQVPPTKPLFTVEVRERVKIDHFYDANLQEPALAARQLNRHLLLQLQPVRYLSQELMMQALYLEIKNLIITTLNLDELSTDDIETEAALFGDGTGLDSIDATELGLAVKISTVWCFLRKAKRCVSTSSPSPRWHRSLMRNVPKESPL